MHKILSQGYKHDIITFQNFIFTKGSGCNSPLQLVEVLTMPNVKYSFCFTKPKWKVSAISHINTAIKNQCIFCQAL